jgi:hypothetical protein
MVRLRASLLRAGALAYRIEPAPQVREIVQILLLARPRNDPRVGCIVGDAVGVADSSTSSNNIALF